uniref:Uncharacterized protein n=1 Tax=Arundo donax TaxID=35708 RepID=A0A0A9BZW3_ARUDO
MRMRMMRMRKKANRRRR